MDLREGAQRCRFNYSLNGTCVLCAQQPKANWQAVVIVAFAVAIAVAIADGYAISVYVIIVLVIVVPR